MPASRVSLNTATVREQWDLRQCVEACRRHGLGGISPWRDKIAPYGAKEAARMFRDAGLAVTGLCRGGLLTASGAAGRQHALDENYRALEEACEIDARCLVLVVGGLAPDSKDLPGARAQVRDGIGALLDRARRAGMPLAIEPLHPMYAADRACVNTLAQANELIDELGEAGLGIACDVYHVWWDPELEREIARAGRRIIAFHVCDWLVPTLDMLLDRGMMGDGVIDIPRIRALVEAAGYDGLCEVEIFSARDWWRRDGDAVLRTVVERCRALV